MTEAAPEAPETNPAPVEDPAVEAPPVETDPPESETEDARVKRANAQAANYRTQLRATETKVSELEGVLGKLAAVFNPEGSAEADPAAQLSTITGEAESLRTENRQLQAELAVHAVAADAGGNPGALLDSRNFTNALHGLDPTADDYRDQVAKAIKDAVSKNATLAAAGQGPSRGGASGAGQGPAQPAGAVTQEQFAAMGYQERTALFNTNPDLYRRLAGS